MSKYTEVEIAQADGPYQAPEVFTIAFLQEAINRLEKFPSDLERVVSAMKPEWQNLPYRTGGWKLKQVIHHIADSHMQAFSRFKLSLTEDSPVIKPYIQNAWAETADSELADITLSVDIIKPLHKRLVILLRSMQTADFDRTYIHPEYNKTFTLAHVVGLYAWHGYHHLRQVEMFMENNR
ncbi:MAG: putative metal-dependent hydrolase [bacterium]|nr:putative metal-dependent hydrolase [bacterium]